jgi:hypothetical protein
MQLKCHKTRQKRETNIHESIVWLIGIAYIHSKLFWRESTSFVLALHWIHQKVGLNVTRHYSRENPRENNSHYIKYIIYTKIHEQYDHHLKKFVTKFQFLGLELRERENILCDAVQCHFRKCFQNFISFHSYNQWTRNKRSITLTFVPK